MASSPSSSLVLSQRLPPLSPLTSRRFLSPFSTSPLISHHLRSLRISSVETRPGVLRLMDEAKNADRFQNLDCFLAGDDVKEKKPDPLIYITAAKRLGLSEKECLVVEDSVIGLQAATNAGMSCVVTYTSSTATQDFSDAIAVYPDLSNVSPSSSKVKTMLCLKDLNELVQGLGSAGPRRASLHHLDKTTMSSMGAKKKHAVCVPFPAQGHVTPMLHLAKLLHSRGFYVTFVNTEFNQRRLVRSKESNIFEGLSDFRFETIPDGLPQSDRDATQDPVLLTYAAQNNFLGPFRELIEKLNSWVSDSCKVPQVTCIVPDALMIRDWCAGSSFLDCIGLWVMAYLYTPELVRRGLFPSKGQKFNWEGHLDSPIDFIPGMRNLRLRDFPNCRVLAHDHDHIISHFLSEKAEESLKTSAIIFNTFDTFEQEVLEAIKHITKAEIYTIGPLPLLGRHLSESTVKSLSSSLWSEDLQCLKWLDKHDPSTVVYVNYGSVTVMSERHLIEFAWGLANSKYPFLWVIRPDVNMGESAILPREFLEETKDRGLMVSWCEQEKVLSHTSIGVFLSHCGWNSTLESICGG
ncbi:Haloacid dehalogenase-like hydrolase, partial [Dillenia turbinata]